MSTEATTAVETLTLIERAKRAYAETQQAQEEKRRQQYQRDAEALKGAMLKTLGVTVDEVESLGRRPVVNVEGLIFGVDCETGNYVPELLSPCPECGQQRSARIYTLTRVGELLANPAQFYHYCPTKPEQDNTPEAKLLAALREFITAHSYQP